MASGIAAGDTSTTIAMSAEAVVTTVGTGSFTTTGSITGSGGLTKSGAGTMTQSVASGITGGIVISFRVR